MTTVASACVATWAETLPRRNRETPETAGTDDDGVEVTHRGHSLDSGCRFARRFDHLGDDSLASKELARFRELRARG